MENFLHTKKEKEFLRKRKEQKKGFKPVEPKVIKVQ